MTFDKLPSGKSAIVLSVDNCDNRTRLLEMGFVPGTTLISGRRSPFGDPAEVLIRGYSLTIRLSDMKKIRISEAIK